MEVFESELAKLWLSCEVQARACPPASERDWTREALLIRVKASLAVPCYQSLIYIHFLSTSLHASFTFYISTTARGY
jgi:hypothetical protein